MWTHDRSIIDIPILSTNNHAKYEAIMIRIVFPKEVEVECLKLQTNSELVVSQIRGKAQDKDPLIQKYPKLATEKLANF